MTSQPNPAPDPRRFAGLSMADAIALIVDEAADEIAAEAEQAEREAAERGWDR